MVTKCLDLNKRYHNIDGGENVIQKATSRSLKLQIDYLNSLTMCNAVGELSWS